MSKKIKEVKLSIVLYSILILIIGYFLVVAVMLYGFGIENSFIRKSLNILPYPAAFVGATNQISITEVEKNLTAVKKFYESQDFSELGYRVDFSTEDGQKRLKIKEEKILNKLIENKVIEILSQKRGLTIDQELISQEVDKSMAQYGTSADVLINLNKLYGWSLEDFKNKIVKPDIYKKQLAQFIKNEDADILAAKNKIETALTELNDGKDFTKVAAEYSEGESAKNGGDLGWLSMDQMIPEIALTASMLEKGKTSNVLESSLGFHILRVEDKKTENNVGMFKLKQIFVKTKNFSEWLAEQEKGMNIYIPLKDFYWDKEIQAVQLKDKNLRDFENKLNENSAGDISVMF